MSQGRPAVPASLKRRLFSEAGYRCAVPTCRGTSALQMEHIEEWAQVREHAFDNMIILCATCHARVTSKEISKDAIRQYKANLAVVNGRYSLYEMRVIEEIVKSKQTQSPSPIASISENDLLHIRGILDDGLVQLVRPQGGVRMFGVSVTPITLVSTPKGIDFARRYCEGEDLLQ